MKITAVEAIPLLIPPRQTHDVPWAWGTMAQVYVTVATDDGLTGIGEAFGYGAPLATAAVINDTLAPLLLGADASRIESLTRQLFQRTHLFGRYGITTFGISGVEMALWDLAGKRAGLPLHELLGGARAETIPAYASLVRYPEADAIIARESRRAVTESYAMVKIHQNEAASVEMARDAIGADVPLTVDVNCAWSPLEAATRADALSIYDLLWLEEPVWPPEDFAGLARVQAEGGIALASGENLCTAHQFHGLLQAEAVAWAQPSVTKVGGVAEWLKVARLAELFGVELAPHSPYFGPGFVATLHLIACTSARWIERFYFDLETDPFTEPLTFADGAFTLPTGPGLGIELNIAALEPYRLTPAGVSGG